MRKNHVRFRYYRLFLNHPWNQNDFGNIRFEGTAPMSRVVAARIIACVFAGLATGSCEPSADLTTQGEDAARVRAGNEILTGARLNDGILAFRGIPFAAPPTGPRRWRSPEPHVPREGVQDATRFGSACPQDQGNPNWYRMVARGFGRPGDVIEAQEDISEDCLYLNVWTQGVDAGVPRPVMVWLYGGSNVNGWSHEPNYRGYNLASRGAVVVSINYRLGPFGFMAHPALSEEDDDNTSGYYGLLDQVAALEWVRGNISAFGGDPDNVTVFGESAGGGNIAALMDMKRARGLFKRAIIESGALGASDRVQLGDAEAWGRSFTNSLSVQTTADMRGLSWQALVEARPAAMNGYYFGPVADDIHVPKVRATNIGVDLLIGSNADEWFMYIPPNSTAAWDRARTDIIKVDDTPLLSLLEQRFPDLRHRSDRLISAAEFLCPSTALAGKIEDQGHKSFVYHFTRIRPGGEKLLAYHGAEIPYVFNTADEWLPSDDVDATLTGIMGNYWLNFAKRGDPNGPGLPQWPRYHSGTRDYMELGDRVEASSGLETDLCTLLARHVGKGE